MTTQARTMLIVNPIAGAGNGAKLWPLVQSRLAQHGMTFDSTMTESPNHATTLARDAVNAGYTTIVSVGGDGTLNEVVNGIFGAQAHLLPGVTVGDIPVGTGVDFARTLGLPRTWEQACDHLLDDKTRIIDIGEMTYVGSSGEEHRYFVNIAGLGFDGEVAARVSRSWKKLGGTLPYLSNLVLTLVTYGNKDVQVHIDDEMLPGRMNSVIVANGQWFGGGMWIAPNASPDDGLFDVIIIGDVGKIELLQTMPRLYKGTHLTHPKLTAARAREVRVDSKQEMWLQADGEALGRAPVTFHIHPQALRLKI